MTDFIFYWWPLAQLRLTTRAAKEFTRNHPDSVLAGARLRILRAEGKSVAEISAITGISKRKLYKHWRHR
jgi:hypothetical protein